LDLYIATNLNTVVFLHEHHPEDGRITGRNIRGVQPTRSNVSQFIYLFLSVLRK